MFLFLQYLYISVSLVMIGEIFNSAHFTGERSSLRILPSTVIYVCMNVSVQGRKAF